MRNPIHSVGKKKQHRGSKFSVIKQFVESILEVAPNTVNTLPHLRLSLFIPLLQKIQVVTKFHKIISPS